VITAKKLCPARIPRFKAAVVVVVVRMHTLAYRLDTVQTSNWVLQMAAD
jgi:hypothetical protein